MTKERELLARAGLIIAEYRLSDPEDKELRELSEQINAYFEENPQDENPVAFISKNGFRFNADIEPIEHGIEVPLYLHPASEQQQESKPIAYWDTQEGKLIPAVPLSSERTCFKVPLIPLYLHPRSDIFDELVEALKGLTVHDFGANGWNDSAERYAIKARAALKKLEEE